MMKISERVKNLLQRVRASRRSVAIVVAVVILGVAALLFPSAMRLLQARSSAERSDSPPATVRQSPELEAGNDLFAEFDRLQEDMDRVFQRAFERFRKPPLLADFRQHGFFQAMNVRDKKDHYEVDVTLPGQDTADVSVELNDNLLKVGVVEKREQSQAAPNVQSQSQMVRSFQQMITLPGPVKSDQMKTERRAGRLIVTIPKA
jgi:HSP20 family protein